jgi:AraC-like DNA-binding protein
MQPRVHVVVTVTVDIKTGMGEPTRITSSTLNDFVGLCCDRPHTGLSTDPKSLSLHQRVGRIGPLTTCEVVVDTDVGLDCGESCGSYRLGLVRSGHAVMHYRDVAVVSKPGDATVYAPYGHLTIRWPPNSRIVAVKIDPYVVDDALSALVGRPVTSPVDFTPAISTTGAAGVTWIRMLSTLTNDLLRPHSVLRRPLVGLPAVDSLVRGLLFAADHRYRDAVAAEPKPVLPRSIRIAIDIIEAEAGLPLTVTTLATRSHISVRGLQDGFRRHLGVSPMTYLRQVRLHRAHRMLQQCDPSVASVTSIAHQWGFTNVSRFGAAHTAHYGETPAVTLRRMARRTSVRFD